MSATAVEAPLGQATLEAYVREVSTYPVYDEEEERRLLRSAAEGEEEARRALVRAHLRTVVDLALDRRGFGVPLVELIHAGNRGLRAAVRRYDPDADGTFSRYAAWWIRQEMKATLEVA